MRVLITNIVLEGRSGTEVVTIELAQGLSRRGHQVAVFAPFTGPSASILGKEGILVTHQIDELPWKPDIIHGHHNIAAAPVLARYLDVPAIFVMHDATQDLNRPPATPQIVRLYAVDQINRDRYLADARIKSKSVDLLPNCVDLDRFQRRDPLPQRPRRALLLTKNSGHIDAVREVARRTDLVLDEIGPAFNRVVDDLHVRLRDYDIVFATARMALEALAVGCAVVVCDGRGLAGLVTADVVDQWRLDNFGLKLLSQRPTVENLLTQVQRYSAQDAVNVQHRIRKMAALSDHLDSVETIYHSIISNWTCSFDDTKRHSEALASFLAAWVHHRGYSSVVGDVGDALAQHVVALADRERIINSPSSLFRRLCYVVWKNTLRGVRS